MGQVKCDRCPSFIPAPDPYFANKLRALLVASKQVDIPEDLSGALCDPCYKSWQGELDTRVRQERAAERMAFSGFKASLERNDGDWSRSWGLVPEPYFHDEKFKRRCLSLYTKGRGKGKQRAKW